MRHRLIAVGVLLALARLCAGATVLPTVHAAVKLVVDGDAGEWAALPGVLTRQLGDKPDGPTVAMTWDGANLDLAFTVPQPKDTVTRVPISLPFSDGLWRRGDRVEWYVTVGDDTFHYVFMPTGDCFRIIVKKGGFEEGHDADFAYKARILPDRWCGEVQIGLEDSPFPLPKRHPDWAMRFVYTNIAAKTTLAWPVPKADADPPPSETVHFSPDPPAKPVPPAPAGK